MIRVAAIYFNILIFFISVFLNGCEAGDSNLVKQDGFQVEQKRQIVKAGDKPADGKSFCEEILRSNCTAEQEEFLKLFYWRLENVLTSPKIEAKEVPPALELLPKDQFGYVNWTKSAMEGFISPQDTLWGKSELDVDKPFDMLIFFQARNTLMADVIFPHSVHNYWLSCRNCHPKIFKPLVGSNPVSMKAIREGKYCGKCHGKVAFPIDPPVEQCRRCHAFFKK